jgi:hypothetical protein
MKKREFTSVEDLAREIKSYEERVSITMSEMTDDFFYKYDPKDREQTFSILWEFKRNSIRADIVFDYVCKIRDSVDNVLAAFDAKDAAETGASAQ